MQELIGDVLAWLVRLLLFRAPFSRGLPSRYDVLGTRYATGFDDAGTMTYLRLHEQCKDSMKICKILFKFFNTLFSIIAAIRYSLAYCCWPEGVGERRTFS